jgi:glycosyltransferase involved in cell wall biosynthesis
LRKLVDDCAVIYSPQEELLTCRGLPSVNTLHGFPALHENILPALARSLPYRRERWKQRALMRRVKRKCCCSFVVSQVLAEEAAGRFGISSAKLRLVGNGVESSFFREELASRPDKKASLLQVGGLNDYDGADWVLPLIEALPEYSVNIVGNRHESPWESRARDLQNVSFSGFVTGSAYRNALREAQALLFLPKAESFGIIGLEALALGVPVIAHRVDGLPETLGDCAFWVEKPEADAVRDALSRIDGLSDAEYRSWQERGLRRAASFTWDKVVDRVREGLELCV